MGLREQILAARIRPVRSMQVPEWGGITVHFRPMSGAQQEAFAAANEADEGKIRLRARLVACSLCDEDGVLLFAEADLDALQEQAGLLLERLSEAAVEVNGFDAKSREELAKN